VQVRYDEGVATHIDPEPCVDVREGGSEGSARERIGQPLSPAKIHIPGADTIAKVEGDSDRRVTASAWMTRRGRRTWHVWKLVAREPADPVCLARPGGNITGVTCITTELSGKRIAVFHEMVPRLKRLAVLYNPENKSKPMDFAQTREAANLLGIDVDGFEARQPQDVDRIFAGFAAGKPDGVSVLDEAFTMINARRIVELARGHGLPSMHSFREPVDAGGLLSYGPSQSDMTTIATTFIGRILKGAKPADLPVQQPTKFELVINLKTAKALGLTVPPTLLARADEVIE
jgi:ABC-type uncharacterized transport system substrate-binding protein